MENRFYFYATVIVAFLIIVLLGYIAFKGDFSEYRYIVSARGVDFVSNSAEPAQLLSEIRESTDFIVAPQFSEKGPENTYMTSALTAFNTVLVGNGKKVTSVGRVLGEDGEIISCQTNLGDARTSKELTGEECRKLLSESADYAVTIIVSFPDTRLGAPRVYLSPGRVEVTPSSFENVSYVSYVFLSGLYPDAESAISRVNTVVQRI